MSSDIKGLRPTRVLVIDDERSIRDLLRRSLQKAHCEVVGEAADGVEGACLADELQPDVVVLDSVMPLMGGEEAALRIRKQVPGVTIVAFSGELQSCPEWADAYLTKGSRGLIDSLVMVVGVSTLGSSLYRKASQR
jgi:AmiR/NasT family two-component response regulator